MPHAFYLPKPWDKTCTLAGQEAKHLSQVLRLKSGEQVLIFDGEGHKGHCIVDSISKREVKLALIEEKFLPRPSSLPIMALAWSKATRRGFFMEKAVELGVHEVWIWSAEHSQGKINATIKEHWQGQCVAAMKQCHNPWLPNIVLIPDGVKHLIELSNNIEHKILPLEIQDNVPMLTSQMLGNDGTSIYVIGPEGGFSKDEILSLGQANFQAVSLGNRILRCETAALLCLGIHWWASQQGPKENNIT